MKFGGYMKRIFAVATAILFCFSVVVFADETNEADDKYADDDRFNHNLEAFDELKEPKTLETIVITPKDQHVRGKTEKVWIEYNDLVEEAIVYYTCQAEAFKQGEAINTIREVLLDFENDRENKNTTFYSYRHIKKDTLRYYKDEDSGFNWAEYRSYVKLYK